MHKFPQQFQTIAHRVLRGYRFPFSDFTTVESETVIVYDILLKDDFYDTKN